MTIDEMDDGMAKQNTNTCICCDLFVEREKINKYYRKTKKK
jgi:hypothetical protein